MTEIIPGDTRPTPKCPVAEFNAWLDKTRVCHGCPMWQRGTFVGVDSATGTMEKQTVLFLGLNPGNEEARIGLPFVGPSGKFLRQQLQKAQVHSWGMANSLLCSSANEAAIHRADESRACCRRNLATIFGYFHSPLLVPCGNGAWSVFKAKMAITPATEQFFISRGPLGHSLPALVLPIFHPSALIRSGGETASRYLSFIHRLQVIAKLANIVAREGVEAGIDTITAQGHELRNCFTGA